jgi:hypothetical protein
VSVGVLVIRSSLAKMRTPGVPRIDMTPKARCGSGKPGIITP